MRVLIIEDESRLARTLADIIEDMGLTPRICTDGVTGMDEALSGVYDAIVLDRMLPGMDGIELLRSLRSGGHQVPVLMLTARSELQDRVTGLDAGADYYLTKPFENLEFRACLRAVLRRQPQILPDTREFEDLRFTPSDGTLSCREHSLRLSAKEKDILDLLITQNLPLSKEAILNRVWGYDSEATSNNVEAYISFLRKKLSLLGSRVTIGSQRNIGYRLEAKNP